MERGVMPLTSRYEIMVEWGDCDPAGIVYYPSYFKWCDQATYRLFLKAGLRRDDVSSGQWREGTPLVAAECSFRPMGFLSGAWGTYFLGLGSKCREL